MFVNIEDEAKGRSTPASIEKVGEALYQYACLAEPQAEVRLDRLVKRLLDLDDHEARKLDALSGADSALFSRDPRSFHVVLQQAIRELRLHRLFVPTNEGEDHRSICPSAVNERTGEHDPKEMARWRSDYRAMAPERQMMAATIIWLYQSGPDSTWLRRVPCTWRVAEALHYMQDAGSLWLWLRFVARYPGW